MRLDALRLAIELGSEYVDVELKVINLKLTYQLINYTDFGFDWELISNIYTNVLNGQIGACLKVAHEFLNSIREKKPENLKIIVSSHNYENTPSVEELGNLVATIQATGCDIVKVATTAVDIVDNARIFQVLTNSQVCKVPPSHSIFQL